MKSRKAMHFHTKRNKKISISLMLASLLLAGFASTRAVFAEETSSSTFPEVGTEWVHVKLPLRTGYYSTAESQHKKLASSEYKVENLSDYPVAVSLSGFVGSDGASAPVTTGIEGLNMNLDTISVPLVKESQAEAFNTSDKNVTLYTLGAGSTTPAPGSFNGKSSGQFNFSGTTQAAYDTTKATVLENQLSFTLVGLDGDGNLPEDQTSINVHDSTLKVGGQWNAEDNFDGGTDELGQALTFDKVTVTGDTVDTATPGSYKVTYTYRNVSKTATVTVEAGAVPPVLETEDTVDFMNEKWDVIKGPDQLGAGNYLIALQHQIGSDRYNSDGGAHYFVENKDTVEGYNHSGNYVKKKIDDWYTRYLLDTPYEKYVQPVVLSNPTLGDMKRWGGGVKWFVNF